MKKFDRILYKLNNNVLISQITPRCARICLNYAPELEIIRESALRMQAYA